MIAEKALQAPAGRDATTAQRQQQRGQAGAAPCATAAAGRRAEQWAAGKVSRSAAAATATTVATCAGSSADSPSLRPQAGALQHGQKRRRQQACLRPAGADGTTAGGAERPKASQQTQRPQADWRLHSRWHCPTICLLLLLLLLHPCREQLDGCCRRSSCRCCCWCRFRRRKGFEGRQAVAGSTPAAMQYLCDILGNDNQTDAHPPVQRGAHSRWRCQRRYANKACAQTRLLGRRLQAEGRAWKRILRAPGVVTTQDSSCIGPNSRALLACRRSLWSPSAVQPRSLWPPAPLPRCHRRHSRYPPRGPRSCCRAAPSLLAALPRSPSSAGIRADDEFARPGGQGMSSARPGKVLTLSMPLSPPPPCLLRLLGTSAGTAAPSCSPPRQSAGQSASSGACSSQAGAAELLAPAAPQLSSTTHSRRPNMPS